MLGKQSGLDGGEHAYLDHVGRDSFYGFLASHRRELFHETRTSSTSIARTTGVRVRQRLHEAAGLLARLLMQDMERREDGTRLKQGVSLDRIVSVHDPEMRHARKSARRRFDGHKA
jgi:hypothetical protein